MSIFVGIGLGGKGKAPCAGLFFLALPDNDVGQSAPPAAEYPMRPSNSDGFRERASNSEENLRKPEQSLHETVFGCKPVFTEPQSIGYNLA